MNSNQYQNLHIRINNEKKQKNDNQIIKEARQATKEIGRNAAKRNISDMSMDEIDSIIALSRKERRTINGG